jgi:hypothetical protein
MIYPSVTQVLGIFSPFNRAGKGINKGVLEAAADRGTRVHEACAAIAMCLPVMSINPDIQGYIDSFWGWFELVDEVVFVEEQLIDETYLYTGIPDLVVRLKDEELLRVVDLKTPVAISKLWAAQVAAYERLVFVATGQPPHNSGTVRLRKNGSIAKFDVMVSHSGDFNNFLCALTAYRAFIGGV